MWCIYISKGGFIVQDPPYVVCLFQHRWVHCTGPPHVLRLFQHRWVHCAGTSSYGASISAQVGSLCRTLLIWCVYFSIGGFIVQDPPHVVCLFQHRWVFVQDPPYMVRLYKKSWVHCTGPSLCGASISAQVGSLRRTLLMSCVYFSIGGFIVQDPPYVVCLFQHRWVHCTGPSLHGASILAQVGSLYRTLLVSWVYFSIGGFIVKDPSHKLGLFQHRWVHCTGPSLYGASISTKLGSLYRTLLMWCVYFSIGGFIVQDPPYMVRLFQHRWVHCAGPFSCGASISAQVG